MALTDSLVSVWELSEASGNALDSHGTNSLTETGGTIGAAAAPAGLAGSRDFEVADTEYFELADNTDLSTGDIDFTMSAWVNFESVAGSQTICGKNNTSPNIEYALFGSLAGAAAPTFRVSPSGTTAVNVTWGAALSAGSWYHVVGWHDSVNNQIGIVVDAGTPVTGSHSTGVIDGTNPFRIGATANGNYFDGLIAQVAFWKRVLTSDERTELYVAGAGLPYSSWDAGGGGVSIPIVAYHRRRRK